MIYFIVLNMMEIPHIMVIYLRYQSQNESTYIASTYSLQAKFYFWFILRGSVLPLLRLIEPQFLRQLLTLFNRFSFIKLKDKKYRDSQTTDRTTLDHFNF